MDRTEVNGRNCKRERLIAPSDHRMDTDDKPVKFQAWLDPRSSAILDRFSSLYGVSRANACRVGIELLEQYMDGLRPEWQRDEYQIEPGDDPSSVFTKDRSTWTM